MRVAIFDCGINMGWAALVGGKAPTVGCRRLDGGPREMGKTMRCADTYIRQVILRERPHAIGFASPHVAMRWDKLKKRWVPIDPFSIRPLFGTISKVEEIAEELKIKCYELAESECRNAFMDGVPRKSRAIKNAVQVACRARGWPWENEHSADALCVGAHLLSILEPDGAHNLTPLFSERGDG